MSDLNAAILTGRLTRDFEVRYVPSGTAVASAAIAVNKKFVQNGEKKESVSFIDIIVWGKGGESCAQYLSKGDTLTIEGSLEQRTWEKDGQKRSKLEVVAKPFGIHFGPKRNASQGQGVPEPEAPPVNEGDIPF
jgi:single-strand DNA-binding protein